MSDLNKKKEEEKLKKIEFSIIFLIKENNDDAHFSTITG